MKTDEATSILSALAQNSRLRVFRLLVQAAPQGLPAGELAARLDVSPATLSFHLKHLTHAGLVTRRRLGRSIIYSLQVPTVAALLSFLLDDCCGGRSELCTPEGRAMVVPDGLLRGP